MSNIVSEAVMQLVVTLAQPGTWWKWIWLPNPGDGEYEITAFVHCTGYSDTEEDLVKLENWYLNYAYQDLRPPGVENGNLTGITFRQFYDAVKTGELTQVVEVPRFVAPDDDYEVVRKVLMGFVSDRRKVVTVQEVLEACHEEFDVNMLLSILYGMKKNHVIMSSAVFLDAETELTFTKRGREVLRDPNRR